MLPTVDKREYELNMERKKTFIYCNLSLVRSLGLTNESMACLMFHILEHLPQHVT